MSLDDERRSALAGIMASPDPPDLPARGHRWTQKGDPARYSLLPRLSNTYSLARLVEREEELAER